MGLQGGVDHGLHAEYALTLYTEDGFICLAYFDSTVYRKIVIQCLMYVYAHHVDPIGTDNKTILYKYVCMHKHVVQTI